MGRLARLLAGLAAFTIAAPHAAAQDSPPATAAVLYATQPGLKTLDGDDRGGNPFASALIEALQAPAGPLAEQLMRGTEDHSKGSQSADIGRLPAGASLSLQPGEVARALVIAFADYGSDDGLPSLPGAAFDAARVAAALEAKGYATRMVIARTREQYETELAAFAQGSAAADRALIYTTGHGVQGSEGIVLIPPEMDGPDLASGAPGAIRLSQVKATLAARQSNWLFYAGCRDNPFDW